MKSLILGLVAAAALAAPAFADVDYRFSYRADGGASGYEFGSGVLTLGDDQSGYEEVLSISGEANGSAITGLSDYAGANNMVFDSGPLVDQGGISVSTASGVDYNFYSLDGVYKVLASTTTPYAWDSNASDVICFDVQPVAACPEPSTWLLMLAGVGGIGLAFRQAKRKHGFRFKDAFAA